MNKDIICFSIMIAGAALSMVVTFRLRRRKETVIAGILTGIVIAALNMMLEYFGSITDTYHVSGPWPLLKTPLPLSAGWVFMTFIYCSVYGRMIRSQRRKGALIGFILGGVLIGWLADYSFYRAGILTLGTRGSPAVIMTVWVVFVPATIFIYEFFMGLFSNSGEIS
jgi:hypothetical protein